MSKKNSVNSNFSEEELVLGFQQNQSAIFEWMYHQMYPVVKNYILKNSGKEDQVADIFHDALLITTMNVQEGKYQSGNLKGYFFQIVRNQWLNALRKMGQETYIPDGFEPVLSFANQDLPDLWHKEKLLQLLEVKLALLDEKCKQVLQSFYFHHQSLQEIADHQHWEYGYAKKKIFTCRNRLKEAMQSDESYQLLKR